MPKVSSKYMSELFFPEIELRRRELGLKPRLGYESRLKYSIYSALTHSSAWTPNSDKSFKERHNAGGFGGIFNLEFSQDGRKLVAACERQAVLMFDPITRKEICKMVNAHSDCVNCIKFLDSRLFASCSDDTTVAIWDVRNLNKKVAILKGHNNWVKNVEYSPNEGLVVTSAFDGKILGWDINNFTESGLKKIELFDVDGLMRTRLNPDGSKLVICTSKGYLLLVHNLSLLDLNDDSKEDVINNDLTKRNRIEKIIDFPHGNVAEMIHSLQIHPQGWCALSRNTSSQNESEWTCVHDIQDLDKEAEEKYKMDLACRRNVPEFGIGRRRGPRHRFTSTLGDSNLQDEPENVEHARLLEEDNIVLWHEDVARRLRGRPSSNSRMDYVNYQLELTARLPLAANNFYVRSRVRDKRNTGMRGPARLTNYIEELNKGPGFIKELCFSPDGRLICSPYDNGIRLMMFDENCSELSHCVQKTPQTLHTISGNSCHTSCVVSTKFSPIDCILVSGSLGGELAWHQPIL